MTDSTIGGGPNELAQNLTRCGQLVSRYGLVVVLAWIGLGKYVKMESRVLIEHSPLMSWIPCIQRHYGCTWAGDNGNRCRASHCAAPGMATSVGGWRRVGRGAFPGDIELFVHHPRCNRDSRRRRARLVSAAGPVPAQGPGADRGGVVDTGRLTDGSVTNC
jgi:hypothetical protein